jgi:phage tail protein X
MPKLILLFGLLLIACTFAACNRSGSPGATPPAETVAPPLPGIEAPPLVSAEGPLQGGTVEIPEIWIVPSLQSKQALAAFLKTTVEQLDWVNPGLEDRVPPGTLIAIPASYRVSAGETLSAISAATGLAEDLLRAANPKLAADGLLPAGTILSMPAVVVMPEATLLGAAAESLNVSQGALLSANPELAGTEAIVAGTVLVLPPTGGEP